MEQKAFFNFLDVLEIKDFLYLIDKDYAELDEDGYVTNNKNVWVRGGIISMFDVEYDPTQWSKFEEEILIEHCKDYELDYIIYGYFIRFEFIDY